MIVHDVTHQTNSVGVIAVTPSVRRKKNGIHGTSTLSILTAFIHQSFGFMFERHGDIETLPAAGLEISQRLCQAAFIDKNGIVFHPLPGLAGKFRVYQRRLAMGARVSHHRVAVGWCIEVE